MLAETFWELFKSPGHWEFEIFLMILFDFVFAYVIWQRLIKPHIHRDIEHAEHDHELHEDHESLNLPSVEWTGEVDIWDLDDESHPENESELGMLIRTSHQIAVDHGFTDASFGERIALLHSELSEALEEFRLGYEPRQLRIEDGKPEGIPAELADVAIRLFDLCGAYGIDLEKAIGVKAAYNQTRPYRHGDKKL